MNTLILCVNSVNVEHKSFVYTSDAESHLLTTVQSMYKIANYGWLLPIRCVVGYKSKTLKYRVF